MASERAMVEALKQELKTHLATIDNMRQTIAGLNATIDGLHETVEGLNATIDGLNATVAELKATIAELNQTVSELRERLGKNSSNSSKPPASDGLNKPAPKSLREPSGKKRGGQKGHPGSTLELDLEPDEVITHVPEACKGCSNREACMNGACVGETRQVVDMVVEVNVTAHQTVVVNECPLDGGRLEGEFPVDVKAPVQYGANLQALTVTLNTVGAVSVERVHEILSNLFGIPLSTGTIVNMVARCAEGLTATVDEIGDRAASSDLLHLDETGTRVDGKTNWVHNASNSEYTHLTVNEKRGKEGMDAGGVLPKFKGTAVHDCWGPYWKFKLLIHALCNAHLLRELIGVIENHPEQLWAQEFMTLLLDMKKAKEEAIARGEDHLSDEVLAEFASRYEGIIYIAKILNPPPPETDKKKKGRKKKGKILSLIERLEEHEESVCLFIYDFSVPFDNNMAERDVRMVKTKTKVSGCFRSMKGARDYVKIMSYVGTAKKQKKNPFEAIRQAILGNPGFIFA